MRFNHAEYDKLTDGERRLVDWQYRMSGSFFKALWEAISRADRENLEKLSKGFPEDVAAFLRYRDESGYWQDIQERILG